MTLTIWPDIGRHLKFKMAAPKPEVEITFEQKELVLMAYIFGSRCRPMSYPSRAWSKMWNSRWNRVEIYFSSKVISTSGFDGRNFKFRMSTDVWPCRECHIRVGHVQNVVVAVETALPSPDPFKSYFCFYFPHVFSSVSLSRHFGTSGQSKREAMTSYCIAFITVIVV